MPAVHTEHSFRRLIWLRAVRQKYEVCREARNFLRENMDKVCLASSCASKHILVWVLTGTCARQAAIDLTQANPNLYVEVPALQDIHGIRLEFSLMKVRPARLAATRWSKPLTPLAPPRSPMCSSATRPARDRISWRCWATASTTWTTWSCTRCGTCSRSARSPSRCSRSCAGYSRPTPSTSPRTAGYARHRQAGHLQTLRADACACARPALRGARPRVRGLPARPHRDDHLPLPDGRDAAVPGLHELLPLGVLPQDAGARHPVPQVRAHRLRAQQAAVRLVTAGCWDALGCPATGEVGRSRASGAGWLTLLS